MKSNVIIFGLSASKQLAENVAKHTKIELGTVITTRFLDNEISIDLVSSVRDKEVFIIQSTSNPANENLMELLITLDAMKRASAKAINVMLPYFGYARQDRKAKGRQPITAKLVADMLTIAGATRIISFDIHSDQLQGFFNIPFDALRAQGPMAKYVKQNYNTKNMVVVSPDHGGVARARAFAKRFDAPLAVIDKRRSKPNQAEAQFLLGEVKDKIAFVVDDMIDTGNTMKSGIELLYKKGAKDVVVVATHAILSGNEKNPNQAIDNLKNAKIKELITTNTITNKDLSKHKFIKVIDLSTVIGDVIETIITNKSISEYFNKKWN